MTFLIKLTTHIMIAILLGLGSAAIALSSSSGWLAERHNNWVSWSNAGHIDSDPYTEAHIIKTRQLPPPPQFTQTFYALKDSDGRALHTSCRYKIKGIAPAARWWSFAVFNHQGQLLSFDENNQSVNSDNALIKPNNQIVIHLASQPQPDNWIALKESGPFMVVLRLYRYNSPENRKRDSNTAPELVTIRRVGC